LLAGNLAGHLAGHLAGAKAAEAKRLPLRPVSDPLRLQITTPRPLRFFPQGTIKLDRFTDGFNFNFRSDKK
jgi:hypothetical protein